MEQTSPSLKGYRTSCALLLLLIGFFSAAVEVRSEGPKADPMISGLVDQLLVGEISEKVFVDKLVGEAKANQNIEFGPIKIDILAKQLGPLLAVRIFDETEKSITEESLKDLIGLKRLIQAAFEENDSNYLKLKKVFMAIGRIQRLAPAKMYDEIFRLLSEGFAEDESRLLSKLVTSSIHRGAEELIQSHKPFEALSLLSKIKELWRTNRTVELGARAIMSIRSFIDLGGKSSSEWNFENPEIEGFVWFIGHRRPSILPVIGDIYSSMCLILLEKNEVQRAELLLRKTTALRPDPDEKNDALRLNIALKAQSAEARAFAMGRIHELRLAKRLGYWSKMRLLFAGYYGVGAPILFFVLGVLFVLGMVRFIIDPPRVVSSLFERTDKEESRAERSARKRGAGYARAVTDSDEYSRLLEALELPDGATEEQIRQAYRRKVKELHPDVQGATPGNALSSDSFVELREIYERVMEIRKGWFGS